MRKQREHFISCLFEKVEYLSPSAIFKNVKLFQNNYVEKYVYWKFLKLSLPQTQNFLKDVIIGHYVTTCSPFHQFLYIITVIKVKTDIISEENK